VTRVRIKWTEVAEYSQVFEVEDFDASAVVLVTDPLEEAIVDGGDWGNPVKVDRTITGWSVEDEG
jgi:hypothetical protein